jgi:hypothetical protein
LASNLKISTAARDAAVDAVTALIDGGTGAGRCEIRTGSPPANVSDASSGTLLATVTFSDPSFGASSSGTATANNFTPDSSADASGDAGYFRIYAGAAADTAALIQGTAGEAADTPDMTFDDKSIVSGGTVDITAMSFSFPIQ